MRLPDWLDKYLFETIQARFHPVYSNMTVIDWNKEQIRDYLGTYFPRSYVESYTIFFRYLASSSKLMDTTDISILDFGSGTGGELFGLFQALKEKRPNITQIKVRVIEGNANALRSYERILCEWRKHTKRRLSVARPLSKLTTFMIWAFLTHCLLRSSTLYYLLKLCVNSLLNNSLRRRIHTSI